MSQIYAAGTCVKLKSGGPEMVVNSYRETGPVNVRGYYCQWFAGKKLDNGCFPYESLEEVISED